MGKDSPKPSNTQTVTSTPYLKSDVQYAAKQAKNLYSGMNPQQLQKQQQLDALNQQLSGYSSNQGQNSAMGQYLQGVMQRHAGGGQTWAPEYQNAKSAYQKLSQGGSTSDPNYASLVSQRDALQQEVGAFSPDYPGFFPDQTYVDYSPETMTALDQITQRATDGSALMGSANDAALATVRGDYLNNNPYLQSVIDNSMGDVTRNFTEQVLPGINSTFAQSGRYGSGIQQNAVTDAVGTAGREAMKVASDLRYGDYNTERQRQLQMASLAPTLAQSDYFDAQQLLGVGSAREALSQAQLQDKMDRFNYSENLPSNMLDQYISRIGALNAGGGTQTSTGLPMANSPNKLLGGLSGAASGLGLASQLGLLGGGAAGGLSAGAMGLAGGGSLLGGMGGAAAGLGALGPVGLGIGGIGLLAGLFG